MAKTSKIKRNWSIGDLTILLWLIAVYSQTQHVPLAEIHNDPSCWKFVNDLITCTTPEQCLFRWMGFKKYRVTEFAWSDEEDYLLKSLQKKYREHSNKWKILAEQLYKLNPSTEKIYRQAKQCKQHFNSFLDPTIKKGLWSKQEDLLLFSAYLKFGCRRRWCLINKFFTNRTENSLKNRFQLLHNRLMNDSVDPSDEPIIIRKYVDGLRTQIRKLEMEDELVLKADQLLKQSSGDKMEQEDTPQREVEIPSPSKLPSSSQMPIEQKKESQMVVKTQELEEVIIQKSDMVPIKEEYPTNPSISNCQREKQSSQLHSPFAGYAPVEFFDGQSLQTIAFPYFNGYYQLPFYQFGSATNLESSAAQASETFHESL